MSGLPPPRGVGPEMLRDAMRACEEIASRDRSNLYTVSRFLRDRRRHEAFLATYAVMRVIDDRVDDVPDIARLTPAERGRLREELADWRERIGAAYAGRPRGDPLDIALAAAVAAFPVPRSVWERFLDAMSRDVLNDRFESLEAFLDYAEGATAAPTTIYVILLTARAPAGGGAGAFETDGRFDALACGHHLGIFAYLAHILRDVARDMRMGERGRVYIPASELAAAGLDADELRALIDRGEGDARWQRLVGSIVRLAERHRREGTAMARAHFPAMEEDCRFILALIIGIYGQLLDRIAASPDAVLRGEKPQTGEDRMDLIRAAAAETGYRPPVLEMIGPDEPPVGDRRFAEYVRLFNEGRFFAAHEVLEDLWLEAPEDWKDGLQGLVQVAVALEHHRRGNASGARTVLDRARRRLSGAGARFAGIDPAALIDQAREHVDGGRATPPRLPVSPATGGQ